MLLKAFKNPALFLKNQHFNFVQLSKYMPRYLADKENISHLNRGPKSIHADFLTLIAMSRNSSSYAHISNSDCKA